jgi:hypothetical protein
LYLAQRIRLLLAQAVLDQRTDQTALRLAKLLLVAAQAVTVKVQLVKMVLLAVQAVVVVMPVNLVAPAQVVKAIMVAQVL